MNRKNFLPLLALCLAPLLTQCGSISHEEEVSAIRERNQAIASEPRGKFFYGRRYHIPFVRFWGYLREPGQPWSQAKLVVMDESVKKTPDRLRETRSADKKEGVDHGFDANYDYRLYGYYTGKRAYEPNTDMVLPVFRLTGYEVLNREPGWLFTPKEKYRQDEISLYPALIPSEARY